MSEYVQPPQPPTITPAEHTHDQGHPPHQSTGHQSGPHGGHMWMMMLMCLPMVAIVGFLIVTQRASLGAIIPALLCVGGMAAMHFLMGGGNRGGHQH